MNHSSTLNLAETVDPSIYLGLYEENKNIQMKGFRARWEKSAFNNV